MNGIKKSIPNANLEGITNGLVSNLSAPNDVRIQETIKVEDGMKPVNPTSQKIKIAVAAVLGVIVLLAGISAFSVATPIDAITTIIMVLIIIAVPAWYIRRTLRTNQVMTYKEVPNPDYDEELAIKVMRRVDHKYGMHMIHKYEDGTYSIDKDLSFYTLGAFSFNGSIVTTNTKTKSSSQTKNGISVGAFIPHTSIGIGKLGKQKTKGTSESVTSEKEKPGKSELSFISVEAQPTKVINAKITRAEAANLERFFS